ncbi:hyaluronan mediated motility receptor isoform 2-T2 [Pholidichthys leucotaenia]
MSFPRAPLRRFNEHVAGDPKGAASFDKSDRFRPLKAEAAAAWAPPPPPSPSSRSVPVSPVRRTVSLDVIAEGSSAKKERSRTAEEKKQQKLLEKEIRSLLQQRGEQDRRLQVLEEELKKVEAKLLVAVREKTSLAASVAALERQRAELKKINEFLKNKVSADATKRRINSLTMELMEARNLLDVKTQELNVLQINTDGHLKVLETDLQAASATVVSLQDQNKDWEDLCGVTKAQNEELENENVLLKVVVRQLEEEIKLVQEYLDAANDQNQDLRLKISEMTKESTARCQLEKLKRLESDLAQCHTELETIQDGLRHKEGEALNLQQELKSSRDALWEAERSLESKHQELESSQKSMKDMEEQINLTNQEVKEHEAAVQQQEGELVRLRAVLRRTERELDERVAHLEQRCLFAEEERSKTQEEGLRRVEELKKELNLVKETRREERMRQIHLQEEHDKLTKELAKQTSSVESLSELVEHGRKEFEEQMAQLKREMKEVLGELALMEEQEQMAQQVAEKSQEVLQTLQKENEELARQLSDTRKLLERRGNDAAALRLEHSSAVTELQGVCMNLLQSTEEATADLERKLLEVQTCLAQKDEEIKGTEVCHTAHISQLQQELQLLKKEREDVLGQLEKQQSRSVTQLQDEWEKAQKLLEEVSREKGEIMEQLHQERDEKVKIQTALQEVKEALVAEKEAHHQVRSEVIRLQAECQRLDEERQSLLSQLELKDQLSCTIENQLRSAEQDKNQLHSRLDKAEQEAVSLQAHLALVEGKMQALQCELEERRQDGRALREQVEILAQEKVTLQWEMEEQQRVLQRQVADAQQNSSPRSETEHWRTQYEALFAKVQPFQEQLNAFAAERDALLNENGANQEQLNKVADAYAQLLGHQNQKQKIKHVMKLKDEKISLQQEVSKLRSLVRCQKSDLEQLKSKLPGAPHRRFDPSKAFQHNKENVETKTN